MIKKLAIASGVALAGVILVVTLVLTNRLATRSDTDQGRYADLCRFGSRYQAAWSGRPRLLERTAAALHCTSLTNYYLERVEADSRALLASGYFVKISLPVPNLKDRLPQTWAVLTNTARTKAAYFEAQLDWRSNEVHLVCRKQDVWLWEETLRKAGP
jgi:hypothetical protein